jgi:hypothetical protein
MQMLALAALMWWQVAGPPRPADGVIEGQILSMDGTPAVGLRVTALSLPGTTRTSVITIAGFIDTDSSGRFRLRNLAAGNYYIMAGALDVASYYPGVKAEKKARVVVVAAGATLSGIDFKLARPAWLRVTGVVKGIPEAAPAGLVRALLTSSDDRGSFGIIQSAPIQPDGSFEFPKVLPGEYLVRLGAASMLNQNARVKVNEKDVHINMETSLIVGRVSIDDGSPLPVSMGPTLIGQQEPVSLVQLRFHQTMPPTGRQTGAPQSMPQTRTDGYFAFEGAGVYQIVPHQMPMGYYLKDARQNPETSQFSVTLTTTPPASEPKGVTLSGRIAGLVSGGVEPKIVRIQMVRNPGPASSTQRVAEVPIGADGTFLVRGVPPGTISITLLPQGNSALQMRVDVADQDITLNLSLAPSPTGAVTFPRTGVPSVP